MEPENAILKALPWGVELLCYGLWELNIHIRMKVQTEKSSLASLSSHSWSRCQLVIQGTPNPLPTHCFGLGCASCRGYGLRQLEGKLFEGI